MTTWIALLRGVNIGSTRSLPMKDLRAMLERLGHTAVQTYIQSGNVVFRSRASDPQRLARAIGESIARQRGFEPRVMVMTGRDLRKAASANPFPQADADPARLHLFFLESAPTGPDIAALEAAKAPSEQFRLKGKVFYLFTPDGFGKSKLAERTERLLGVAATARNWRTVTALLEMADRTG